MKLLQKLLESAENVAIKVQTYGSSGDEPVSIHEGMNDITLRLKSIPTEIKIPVEDLFESYYKLYRDPIMDAAKAAGLSPDDVKKFLDIEGRHDLFFSGSLQEEQDRLTGEIGKVVDHLTTILKAKLVEYSHDLVEKRLSNLNAARNKVLAEIKKLAHK